MVKDSENTSDPAVRNGYGRMAGLVYIACNLLLGDAVAWVTSWLEQLLQSMQDAAPQLYDMLLSTWSSMGLLSETNASPFAAREE